MNEWLKKLADQAKTLWSKWTLVQKLVLFGVVLLAIGGAVAIIAVSSAPTMVKLIQTQVKDQDELERITSRLESEGIKYQVKDGYLMVANEKLATRARTLLVREDLLPKGTTPWDFFKMDKWTLTDFDRKINLRQAIIQELETHIQSLDDVDKANISITMPDKEFFSADQKEVTASIIISPAPGSDICTNRKKLEGLQRLVKLAIEGLKDENIVITDMNGQIVNDFAGLADMDKLDLTKREQKFIREQEAYYRAQVLKQLQGIYGMDRVRDLNIKIHMDMSKKEIESKEFLPFVKVKDDPNTPYNDAEIMPSVTRSASETTYEYQGTGFYPEGPAGVEGQTAPSYKDMSNMQGKALQKTTIHNEEIGERKTQEVYSPKIDRITASVNIDGSWEKKTDAKGHYVFKPNGRIERDYLPLNDDERKSAESLIKGAIGYDSARNDTVTVQCIAIDRTNQFKAEDLAIVRNKQIQDTVLYSLLGLAGLMVFFIVFRLISRELERRKRLREEELARRHQMMRESALRQAEEEGVEVSMSVEERKRLEMQENAINMAKEHPEDVAQLIRTWLMEE